MIGDTVNVASRLEAETKTQNTPLIISGAVFDMLSNPKRFEAVGDIDLRGRKAAIPAYRLREST